MARTRTTRSTTTVKVDVIDKIVEELNKLEGIEFAKDAWVNNHPDPYGVVQLSSTARQLWADGRLIDTAWNVIVSAFVSDDDNSWPEMIQQKLEALEADGRFDLTHTVSREERRSLHIFGASAVNSLLFDTGFKRIHGPAFTGFHHIQMRYHIHAMFFPCILRPVDSNGMAVVIFHKKTVF